MNNMNEHIESPADLLVGKTIASVEEYYSGNRGDHPDSGEPYFEKNALRLTFTDGTRVQLAASYDDSSVHVGRI